VDRNVETEVALHGVQLARERRHRFVDAGERHTQGRDHADGVLVAVLAEVPGRRIAAATHVRVNWRML
jgi:hypothetical protein